MQRGFWVTVQDLYNDVAILWEISTDVMQIIYNDCQLVMINIPNNYITKMN